jgi:lycopene beta-cyclase
MDQYQYLIVLFGCLALTLPLELWIGARVWRQPRRLWRALWPPLVIFGAWDLWATAQGHWRFSPELTTGVPFAFGVPIDEVFFFVAIPLCGLLTLEAVRIVLDSGRMRNLVGGLRARTRAGASQ